jgi:PII-like signaling protein
MEGDSQDVVASKPSAVSHVRGPTSIERTRLRGNYGVASDLSGGRHRNSTIALSRDLPGLIRVVASRDNIHDPSLVRGTKLLRTAVVANAGLFYRRRKWYDRS